MSTEFPAAQAVVLAETVEYPEGGITSRVLARTKAGNLTLFAFDKGQELSEHSAPFDAYVQVLEGNARLVIGGEAVHAPAGTTVLMPKDVPHAVEAPERFKMLLIMIKG